MSGSTESSVLERKASLLRLESETQKLEYKLGEKPIYIVGRERECDVCVYISSEISRKHAEIKRSGNAVYQIRDLGSKNGTYINGKRIGDSFCSLKNNDKVGLGLHVSFVFKQGMS